MLLRCGGLSGIASSSSVARKFRFRNNVFSDAPLVWKKFLSTLLTSFLIPATSFLSCQVVPVFGDTILCKASANTCNMYIAKNARAHACKPDSHEICAALVSKRLPVSLRCVSRSTPEQRCDLDRGANCKSCCHFVQRRGRITRPYESTTITVQPKDKS